ncbi:MAG TPA: hypothetical protein VEP66_13440 [Myxococcales bacterium]|nr:hypothetical protein [Myxococcales bacterium]
MRLLLAILCLAGAVRASPAAARKASRSEVAGPARPAPARPDATTSIPASTSPQAAPAPPPRPTPAQAVPRRFGRFDLDMPFAQVRTMPDLAECAQALAAPAGRAECALPRGADNLSRVQLAWEESRNGGELIALRLLFDPQLAPALTDVEWQLTRGWGAPTLEQLRRDRDQKFFTLQWEDGERRATLEAQGTRDQPSRAIAVVLERKQVLLTGDFSSLHPRPFPGFRVRWVRRAEWEGQLHAVIWGTSLTPAQEAMGEQFPAWVTQRNYVGIWRLEPAAGSRPRRWRPLWERLTGGEDDEQLQRVLYVDIRDVTGDATPDLVVELACETCGSTADEVIVKTVRAGKLVDLLAKRDLYRAQVELGPGQVRIREPEGEDDQGLTVSTYAYDRGKGAFVLAREERAPRPEQ